MAEDTNDKMEEIRIGTRASDDLQFAGLGSSEDRTA